MKHVFIASASELQASPLFLQITTPMFLAEQPNLNKVRCSGAFIDEIIANQDRYVGLPLAVDIKNLTAGRLERLGHMYNPITGTYGTTPIGSFQSFEKQELGDGIEALVGYVRVWKRNAAVCRKLSEMFADGKLQFSFEINAGSQTELPDGTILIDAAENNYLEGMCVVSFPACPEAVAEQLVAELIPKDGDTMDKEKMVAETEGEEVVTAETETEVNEVESEVDTEEESVNAEAENAEVEVTQTHYEVDEVETHDWEKDEHAMERVTHEVRVTQVAEENESQPQSNAEVMMAELLERINDMSKRLAELAEAVNRDRTDEVIAEIENSNIGEQEAKLTAEIEVSPKEYSLLQPDEKIQQYTLL